MAAINFPSSPTLNQTHTANGVTWVWNGTSWIDQTSPSAMYTLATAATNAAASALQIAIRAASFRL